jgi:hypothetical protein
LQTLNIGFTDVSHKRGNYKTIKNAKEKSMEREPFWCPEEKFTFLSLALRIKLET